MGRAAEEVLDGMRLMLAVRAKVGSYPAEAKLIVLEKFVKARSKLTEKMMMRGQETALNFALNCRGSCVQYPVIVLAAKMFLNHRSMHMSMSTLNVCNSSIMFNERSH